MTGAFSFDNESNLTNQIEGGNRSYISRVLKEALSTFNLNASNNYQKKCCLFCSVKQGTDRDG